jgi:hypothetical protein
VKKTESLLEPVVGLIKTNTFGENGHAENDLRLAWHDNSWAIRSFNYVISFSDPVLAGTPTSDSYDPDDLKWKAVQACFVSDEAATAAVKALVNDEATDQK